MIPTVFGILVGAVGIVLLLRASVSAMFAFMIGCSLMGGSAAFVLPALGGSSIPPVQFALGFLVLRFLLPGSHQGQLVREAFAANLFLVIFVVYGVVMAHVGPRLFAGHIHVVTMKALQTSYMFATVPLAPTSQNITASVYMIGTLMCSIGAYVAARNPGGAGTVVKAGVFVAWTHIFFGVTGVLFKGTGYDAFLDLFRNGSYAMLDQRIGSVVRMNGILPEPSSFAGFGFAWFVFLFECWYRGVRPGLTGPVALAMALTLAASTSSTAYLGLAAYTLIFLFRTVFLPDGVSSAKVVRILLVLLVLVIAVSGVLILQPGMAEQGLDVLAAMTINKQGSDSALQRGFWARQGLTAFNVSRGLGIGPGSFRSSSLPTAVLGSLGVVGSASLILFLVKVLKPIRASTWNRVVDPEDATGVAAAWAAIGILIPATFASPTPDPGSDFAIFVGTALALRRRATAPARPARSSPQKDQTMPPSHDPGPPRAADPARSGPLRIFVVFATVGRPAIVRAVIDRLARQTRAPDAVVVASVTDADVAGVARSPLAPEILFSAKGLCIQRNRALDHIGDRADVVLFLDDDFVPADTYLAELDALFRERPTVVGATGRIIADGITGPGYGFDEAVALVAADDPPHAPKTWPAEALYGCNMALRLSAMDGLRFDEALPLYGWLEDIDLTYRIARRGALIRSQRLAGVHMGTKGGRSSGVSFGYSQLANPIYMLRKRSVPVHLAWRMMARNVAANLVRSVSPEPHIDRRGRLRGNLIAFAHLLTARIDPRHAARV